MKYLNMLFLALLLFACSEKEEQESVHEPVAGLTEIASLNQINDEVSSGVSMIFFHASWCSICQAQRPAVSEVATDTSLNSVFFGEVEYDDHPDIINEYNIQAFPTLVVLKDGMEVDRLNGGGHASADIKNAVESQL